MCYFAQFLLGGGILTSCNKEAKNQQPVKTYDVASDYANLNEQIADFKATMLNHHKSGEFMQLNEAIWMMEATFNYYHSFVGLDFIKTKTDTIILPVEYNGFDEVPMNEIAALYTEVNNAIVSSFENYVAENKKPYSFDLELQATIDGSELLILVTNGAINSQKSTKTVNTIDPFGSDDYWYPAFLYGKCGIYAGNYVDERSADTELKRASLNYIKLQFNPIDYYFADIVTIVASPTPNDYTIWDGEEYDCITPSEMNAYFHGLESIIEDYKPEGKTFVTISVSTIEIALDGEYYHHWNHPQYGVKTERDQLPEEPSPF